MDPDGRGDPTVGAPDAGGVARPGDERAPAGWRRERRHGHPPVAKGYGMGGDAGNQRRGGPVGRGPSRIGQQARPGNQNQNQNHSQGRSGGERGSVWRPDVPPPPSSPEDEERAGVFRETLSVGGWHLDLVARQPVGGSWGAWVRRASGGGPGAAGGEDVVRSITATGPTAAEALASLVASIRTALGQPSPPPQPDAAP